MLKYFFKFILKLFFRVKVSGLENYNAAGNRVLLVSNVGSLLDILLISIFMPNKPSVIIDLRFSRKWWLRPVLSCSNVIEVDFTLTSASLQVIKAIEKHQHCIVFHEKLLHHDAKFMKILEATALITLKAKACILPIRIDGAAYSVFSYFRHKQKLRYFPKITLNILPPQFLDFDQKPVTKEIRKKIAGKLYKIMSTLKVQSANVDKNLVESLVEAISVHGKKYVIAEDHERKTLTYANLFLKSHVLGKTLANHLKNDDRVGFMLPSSLAGIVAFFALHIAKKVPALINFTAGALPVVSACNTVQLKTIVTSRRFIKLAELEYLEKAILESGVKFLYLEDIANNIPISTKIIGLICSKFFKSPKTPASNPAAIMFTSGTEGTPKAVFVSHRNLNVNKEQVFAIVDIHSGDRFFNALPMFHTFGLGIGTILPITSGIKLFMYPSPLHYRTVPQLFYESQSTVICGTDTFFTGYAKYGRPYDFCNARLVIAGAEKLRESTIKIWKEKFGVDILEGYGTTETSPVLAVNTPANKKAASVGRILPAMDYYLKPIENILQGGALCVNGGNVMLGYMHSKNPGVLEPPREDIIIDNKQVDGYGWYDTGDIVEINDEDFIFIKGRAKRFAKLGGEMVSLVAVEQVLSKLWEETVCAVVAIPDDKKGEQLILIIEKEDITTSQIAAFFASQGISSLWVPKKILSVKQVPLLGSGKIDYVKIKEMAIKSVEK